MGEMIVLPQSPTLSDELAQQAYDKFMEGMHQLYVDSMTHDFCGFVIEDKREAGTNKVLAVRLIACDNVGGMPAKRVA